MRGGGSKLKVQGTDSYPVNECMYVRMHVCMYSLAIYAVSLFLNPACLNLPTQVRSFLKGPGFIHLFVLETGVFILEYDWGSCTLKKGELRGFFLEITKIISNIFILVWIHKK